MPGLPVDSVAIGWDGLPVPFGASLNFECRNNMLEFPFKEANWRQPRSMQCLTDGSFGPFNVPFTACGEGKSNISSFPISTESLSLHEFMRLCSKLKNYDYTALGRVRGALFRQNREP